MKTYLIILFLLMFTSFGCDSNGEQEPPGRPGLSSIELSAPNSQDTLLIRQIFVLEGRAIDEADELILEVYSDLDQFLADTLSSDDNGLLTSFRKEYIIETDLEITNPRPALLTLRWPDKERSHTIPVFVN